MGEGEFPKDRCSKDDVIDIDGLVFNEMLPGENLFPLQIPAFPSFAVPDGPREIQMEAAYFCNKDPSAAFNEDLLTEITEYCK
ncbi:hypothetical protein HN51_025975 [Arachis hypogaea]